jgi:hypothetical protein
MSKTIGSLTYTPRKFKPLKGALRPWFEAEGKEKHEKEWAPYERFGIQPNDNGVQVYHQPQSARAIRMLAKVLINIADRMEERWNVTIVRCRKKK